MVPKQPKKNRNWISPKNITKTVKREPTQWEKILAHRVSDESLVSGT